MKAKILKWTKRNEKEKKEKKEKEICIEKILKEFKDPTKNYDFIPIPLERKNAVFKNTIKNYTIGKNNVKEK
jgi:hypothetical protein